MHLMLWLELVLGVWTAAANKVTLKSIKKLNQTDSVIFSSCACNFLSFLWLATFKVHIYLTILYQTNEMIPLVTDGLPFMVEALELQSLYIPACL
jgi:hypothetical protein